VHQAKKIAFSFALPEVVSLNKQTPTLRIRFSSSQFGSLGQNAINLAINTTIEWAAAEGQNKCIFRMDASIQGVAGAVAELWSPVMELIPAQLPLDDQLITAEIKGNSMLRRRHASAVGPKYLHSAFASLL